MENSLLKPNQTKTELIVFSSFLDLQIIEVFRNNGKKTVRYLSHL